MKPICPTYYPWKDYKKYTYPLGLDLGSICFLSGTSASEYDAAAEKIVTRGDLRTQTETALEKIRAVLVAANYSLKDVVSLIQYVTPDAFENLCDLKRVFGRHGIACAAAHVVPVNRLMRRDALIELEVIAAKAGTRKYVSRAPDVIRVLSGKSILLFPGATTGDGAHGSLNEAVAAEVGCVAVVLKSANLTWSDVVRCRLVLMSEQSAEIDEAIVTVNRLVPDLPVVPAIGVAAAPRGARRAQLLVEISAPKVSGPSTLLVAKGGGLVRQVGPFLIATGLQSDRSDLSLIGQVERIYSTIVPDLLKSVGIRTSGIVQTIEWITQDVLPDYRQTGAVRRKYLCEPFPVASGLACSALPAGRKISIDVVAVDQTKLSGAAHE
jgi:enamine deaminase RidA (YjgF/YER057c/UK114 family)